jgi:hypothetical protein
MRFGWIIILSLSFAGCASTAAYNPMQVASQEELLLNENGFKLIQEGMSMDQVHKIMGTELVIGYSAESSSYKPLTIPNPYKSEAIKGTDYFIEYYIEAIRQPDGIVSDNELMPLIFKDSKLMGRGWSLVNSLRLVHPSA